MTIASPAHLTRSTRLDAVQLRALLVGALVTLEVVAGPLSVHLSPPGTQVAMFWPNAGLSVAALCLARPSWRSSVTAAILGVTVVANYLGGRPLDMSLAFGLANAAGAAIAIWVLTRGGRTHPQLQNLEDFFRLAGAAFLSAGVSGAIAGGTIAYVAQGDAFVTWRTLLASHGAAIVLIAPLAMKLPRHAKQAGTIETVLQWASLLAVVALVFSPAQGLPLMFLPFPLLVWGAARLTAREVTLQLLAFFTVVSLLTSAGLGPVVANIRLVGAPPDLIGMLLQAQVLAAVLVAVPMSLVKTQQLITVDKLTHSHGLVSNILASTTATAILGTDLDGRIEFFNVGAERMTGYAADEVIGKATVDLADFGDGRLRMVIAHGDAPDARRLTSLVGPFLGDDGETSFTSDWDLVPRDGGVRTISVTTSRRYGDDGEPIGFLAVAEDVTDRRRHEAVVAAALETEKQIVERLAQVDQTKNDFLSTVSHELRTPITSILGYSQLLVSDDTGALPAMHQQIIGRIERNGRRLMGLIEDMLTMSQVEVGNFSFDKTPIDLRDPVCSAIEAVHGTVAVNDLDLDLDLGLDAVQVYGDPDKLERVFVNLLSNAAKFSHAGDKISVHLNAEGDHAVLKVVDSGIGIGPDDQAHLFDRFFRGADAHALAIQGVGLGLPIAGSIVAGHDGRIDVVSELGRGSTFVVRLPLLGHGADGSRRHDEAACPDGAAA
jgi:signal transduction histidine kinase/integral membrane sensor domain MASE1